MITNAITLRLSLMVLICLAGVLPAAARAAEVGEKDISDILQQVYNFATPAEWLPASRIAVATAATQPLASLWNVELTAEMQESAMRQPQAYFPASDTSYEWIAGWQPLSRDTYHYTGTKKNWILSEVYNAGWENGSKITWTYDGSSRISYFILQGWDNDSVDWVNINRISFSYDGSSTRTTVSLTSVWDGESFIDFSRTLYTYDGNNRLSTIITQSYLGVWTDATRTTFTYDGNGNETLALLETKVGVNWVNSSQTISTYDGSNRQLDEIVKTWNGAAFVNSAKNEYSYDGNDNLTLDKHSVWVSSAWSLSDVDTMKYDGSNRLIQEVFWTVSSGDLSRTNYTWDGSGNVTEMIDQNYVSSWVNDMRSVFVYQQIAVQVDESPLPDDFALLQNHPNPFNPTTTIRYSLARPSQVVIEVWNVLGQRVRVLEDEVQAAGVYETTWDGRNASGQEVASGVYFYTLRSGNFTQTRKMVLLR